MKMYYSRFLTIVLMVIVSSSIKMSSLEPTWSIDLGSVFDNREGEAKHTYARTYFFTSLSPEIGLKFTDKDRIAGGAVWTQPLENGVKDGKIIPTLYYRHESDSWSFSMGLFPMSQLKEPLPGFIWCDSLTYFQKNIRGALVQYNHDRGWFDAYIDWRQHQKDYKREAFNILFQGEWKPFGNTFLGGAHLLMNHFAKTRIPDSDQWLVDNFLVNPYIGADLSGRTVLDVLKFKVGCLMTVERHRKDGGWNTPGGIWIEACAEWKFLGMRNSFYAGGNLYPLYGVYGNLLYQGESYYHSSLYDRADLYAKVYRNKFMDLEAQLNFNIAKGDFMFYQRLILNIHLGNL